MLFISIIKAPLSVRLTWITMILYRTTSDYRLKENQVAIPDGIERVKQLNPYRFNWISTGARTVDGFFAHEVQTVVPVDVSGSHNAVDDDNNPVYQGIDLQTCAFADRCIARGNRQD